ncbi:Uncharacterized protein FKW44_021708, partial [Caligus rogercresseyi]
MDIIPFTLQTLTECENHTSLMAIDFAKAFDSLSHNFIVQTLYKKGFGDFIIRM